MCRNDSLGHISQSMLPNLTLCSEQFFRIQILLFSSVVSFFNLTNLDLVELVKELNNFILTLCKRLLFKDCQFLVGLLIGNDKKNEVCQEYKRGLSSLYATYKHCSSKIIQILDIFEQLLSVYIVF